MGLVSYIVNFFVFLNLNLLELSEIFMIHLILYSRIVALAHIQTTQLLLNQYQATLMKLDSRSSATMVCDLIFDPIL